MKVSDVLELNLIMTFTNKRNKSKDVFNVGDYVVITYYDCNDGVIHTDGVIMAFNASEVILQKEYEKIDSIFYSSIRDIVKL